jgi:flavin reductase (DIM6/NTAB) family NADH-FMN oxidoreductase RutF
MTIDLQAGEMDWRGAYALCIGFIAPRPIGWVSTISTDRRLNLAPFSFYNMVSANPPTVMFCPGLGRDGLPKDSLRNVEDTGEFVVATATRRLAQKMVATAADLPYGESEFDFAGLTPTAATHVAAPLVREASCNIECQLWKIVPTGSQPGAASVVFGHIVAIHVDDAVLDDNNRVDPHKLELVGRLGGQYYCDVTNPYELHIAKPS